MSPNKSRSNESTGENIVCFGEDSMCQNFFFVCQILLFMIMFMVLINPEIISEMYLSSFVEKYLNLIHTRQDSVNFNSGIFFSVFVWTIVEYRHVLCLLSPKPGIDVREFWRKPHIFVSCLESQHSHIMLAVIISSWTRITFYFHSNVVPVCEYNLHIFWCMVLTKTFWRHLDLGSLVSCVDTVNIN